MGRPSWSAEDLSTLLGCSFEDVEAMLALFGFSYVDGLWRQEGDDAARILAAAFEEAAATRFELSEDDRQEFEACVEQLVRSA
jgi:hypothetical protein